MIIMTAAKRQCWLTHGFLPEVLAIKPWPLMTICLLHCYHNSKYHYYDTVEYFTFVSLFNEQPVKINMEVDMLNYLDATHKTYFNHVDETQESMTTSIKKQS